MNNGLIGRWFVSVGVKWRTVYSAARVSGFAEDCERGGDVVVGVVENDSDA